MTVHYLEIVSNDVDTLTALYQRVHGLSFGPPDADLGQARVATRADGTLVGIRKPLAAHEQPIMRTYLAVEDIHQAVKNAEDSGAAIAAHRSGVVDQVDATRIVVRATGELRAGESGVDIYTVMKF